jgi:LmbE family N-acetylglucosaminyl deacetylase
MRILAIGAHPDDLEIFCGGTLALYARQGHEVFMCHALNGNLGHHEIPRKELRRIRRAEAEKAARLIGAVSLTLDIDDLDIYDERPARLKMMEIIRQARPDFMILPNPEDYMPDHTITSAVGFGASFMASLPQLLSDSEPYMRLTPLAFMDTAAGINFQPEEYVDISPVEETKRQMVACHDSQVGWLKTHDGIDMVEYAMQLSAFRGMQAGVRYAEAFRQLRAWGRIATRRYLP